MNRLLITFFIFLPSLAFTENPPFDVPLYYALSPAVAASQTYVADINQDKSPDLILLNSNGKIVVLKNDGRGGLLPPQFLEGLPKFRRIVTGQFNQDSFPDVAGISTKSRTLSVLINSGDSTFLTNQYSLSQKPVSLAVGDLNKDTIDDIAVLTSGERYVVEIFLGASSGNFQRVKNFKTAVSTSLALGYFDHDAWLDVAVTSYYENKVAIFRGNGLGEFGREFKIQAPAGAKGIFSSDLNSDGLDDLIGINIFNQVFFLNNKGHAHFEAPHIFELSGSPDVLAISKNVGQDPSVILNDGEFISVFTRTKQGYSQRRFYFSASEGLAVVDWNGDGKNELVLNVFSFMILVPLSADGLILPRQQKFFGGLGAADFNQDGHLDLLGNDVYFGNGDGTFQKSSSQISADGYPQVAYLNNDSAPDLAIIRQDGQSTFRLNDGQGNFAKEQLLAPGENVFYGILTSDLNHDGINDFVAIHGDGFSTWMGQGHANFAEPFKVQGDICIGNAHLADLDQDGNLDLVNPCWGYAIIRYGNGDGTFQKRMDWDDDIQSDSYGLAIHDWNRDGLPDLVFFYVGFINFLPGIGSRRFGAPQTYKGRTATEYYAIDDFDNDGWDDLVAISDVLVLYYGKSNASDGRTFSEPIFFGCGKNSPSGVSGDFNDDGFPDLAISSYYRPRTIILLNQNGRTAGPTRNSIDGR